MVPEPPLRNAPKEAARKPQPDPKAGKEKAAEKGRQEEKRKAAANPKVLLEKADKARSEQEKRERQAAAKNAASLIIFISGALWVGFNVFRVGWYWLLLPVLLILVGLVLFDWKNPRPRDRTY